MLLLVLIGLSLGGFACSGAPAIVYYTLDPLPQAARPDLARTGSFPKRVGIGPVQLPTYLERTQIVTRAGDHTLAINDFHRWAGPLDEEVVRIMVVAVGEALPGTEVIPYPWERRREPTHQVRLTVQRFDGQMGRSVHLRGIWTLTCHVDPEKSTSKTFDIAEATAAPTMQALVAAQNRALGVLSAEIVDALCEAVQ
jgi:uncharacterized lipoprotein YmbA